MKVQYRVKRISWQARPSSGHYNYFEGGFWFFFHPFHNENNQHIKDGESIYNYHFYDVLISRLVFGYETFVCIYFFDLFTNGLPMFLSM